MSAPKKHTILCVDDEANILNALKRLLRKEDYRILTATSGAEGLEVLAENEVHLVISDHRMPEMTGTEFLGRVKDKYPDILRITLSGYTEVDSITDAINKGHIYKFFLKPWNDASLILEIRQALDQYDLIQANKSLDEQVIKQNAELKQMNETLEEKVNMRTRELEVRNQALNLSRTVLDCLPFPIVGVSPDGVIALINQKAASMTVGSQHIELGGLLLDFFPEEFGDTASSVLADSTRHTIHNFSILDRAHNVVFSRLSDRFSGDGVVLTFLTVDSVS